MLVDTKYDNKSKAAAVKQLAEYIMSDDCTGGSNASLGYVVLSGKLKTVAQSQVNKIG
jgi:hypothetical protein